MICTVFNNPAAARLKVPGEILSDLAGRFRPAGAYLMLWETDGTLVWHDADAPAFFEHYVLPQVRDPHARQIMHNWADSSAAVSVVDAIPGILLAVCPLVERRKVRAVLMLAGMAAGFHAGEDVQRLCSQMELDVGWLKSQADKLPSFDVPAMQRQGELLLGMLQDQTRLAGIEGELDSLSTQLAATYEELTLIYQISSGMKINRSACEFFKQACHDVMQVMDVRAMGVTLQPSIACGSQPAVYGEISLPAQALERLSGQLLETLPRSQGPLLINDTSSVANLAWLGQYTKHLLAVPLQRQDQSLGCLFAMDKRQGDFDSTDAKLLTSIANEAAVYLENARLFEDVHGLMMGLLHSLTSAVDAKDAYTCGHSERVALLSRTIAAQAGLDENRVERTYMAGLLHDVGKIGVPEAVLRKTGRLTAEEFEEIKKHPAIGARILQDVKQVADIIPGVLHHHERYDGKGYPAGLAGVDIPLMGRMICMADCFDAMTSSRTYRKAMPLEAAMTEIRRCSGTQFDPELAEVFLGISVDTLRELLHDHHQQRRPLMDVGIRPAA